MSHEWEQTLDGEELAVRGIFVNSTESRSSSQEEKKHQGADRGR